MKLSRSLHSLLSSFHPILSWYSLFRPSRNHLSRSDATSFPLESYKSSEIPNVRPQIVLSFENMQVSWVFKTSVWCYVECPPRWLLRWMSSTMTIFWMQQTSERDNYNRHVTMKSYNWDSVDIELHPRVLLSRPLQRCLYRRGDQVDPDQSAGSCISISKL